MAYRLQGMSVSVLLVFGLIWWQSSEAQITVSNISRVYPPINESDSRVPLFIGLMLSFGGGFVSAAAIPGVQIALDLINEDEYLLPGYTLHYSISDSQCDHSLALQSFFHRVVWEEPVKYALIGGGCSVATEPTADISHFYNITHLSCASSSPELKNRSRFKKYFQLLATDLELVPAYFGVLQYFEWNQVIIIQQEENLFLQTVESLRALLMEANQQRKMRGKREIVATVKTFRSSERISEIGERDLFGEGATIYILAMYSDHAKSLICEAYKRRMTYPRYVFMTYGWYASDWWIPQNDVNCTTENMEQVLNHSLSVFAYPSIQNESQIVKAGINLTRLVDTSIEVLNTDFRGVWNYIPNAEQCFDAVWAFTLALNKTLKDLELDSEFYQQVKAESGISDEDLFKIENFTYNNYAITSRIFGYLQETDFLGITGNVSFNEEGIRAISRLRVQQYRRDACDSGVGMCLVRSEIGLVSVQDESFGEFVYLSGEDNDTSWPSGIPHDGTPFKKVLGIAVPLTASIYIFASVGIVFAIVCFVFVFYFRKKKLIRLTSPNLNYVICCGALMLYISVYFYAIHSTSPEIAIVICYIRVCLSTTGYSIAFGPVLGKMWRVYYIFTNPKPKKKGKIKDWHLALLVTFLVTVDVIILLVASVVHSTRLKATLVPYEENIFDVDELSGVRTEYCVYICKSESHLIWLGVIYGYKAFFQVIAILLAFGTRKVEIEGLNDAKYIAGVIYVTSIVLAVIIVSFVTLDEYLNALAAVYSVGFTIAATVILGLVFVPKMVAVYKDPDGNSIFPPSGFLSQAVVLTRPADTSAGAIHERVYEPETKPTKHKDTSGTISPATPTHSPEAANLSHSCDGPQDVTLQSPVS